MAGPELGMTLWPEDRAASRSRSFDQNDNWIETASLPLAVANWETALAGYLLQSEHALEGELAEYLTGAGFPAVVRLFAMEKVIAQAEVYWEFRADDAVEAARYYGRSIQAHTSYDVVEVAYRHNSVSYRVELSKGPPIGLSVYAKTPDRVRFEVQYKGRISRAVAFDGETDLVRRLLLIRSNARNRLAKALAPVVRDTSKSFSARHAWTELMSRVAIACEGSRLDMETALNLLVSTRRLVRPVAGVPASVIDSLLRQGVIRLKPRGRGQPQDHYVVAPLYQWVLDRLDQAFPPYDKKRWTQRFKPYRSR
jgi:hypothetical protein